MTENDTGWTCPHCEETTDRPETESLETCPALDTGCTRVACPNCGKSEDYHVTGCGIGQKVGP